MRTFREIKRQARRQLHDRLADTVLYLATPTAQPYDIAVRLHLSFEALGELRRAGMAERQDTTPVIVFMASQVVPRRDAIVVTKDMGGWKVDNTMPPDDITISAEATKLSDTQIRGLGMDPEADWLGLPPPGTD